MNVFLVLVALAAGAPPLQTEEVPRTRLFVRTVPPGAKIILDGEPLGQSHGLFLVPPGVRKVIVELDGYYQNGREIKLPEGWITRVELELTKRPRAEEPEPGDTNLPEQRETAGSGPPPDDPSRKEPPADSASKQAAALLAGADLPDPVRTAMLTVLRQHPAGTRWSGRSGPTMFGIGAKRLPGGDIRERSAPALMQLTHMLAVQELLRAKSPLDRYAATGQTDATTLCQAVEEAAGKLEVSGNVKGLMHQTTVRGEFAVGYVVADESALTAHLLQPAELEKVQGVYRDVMHRQARELMKQSNWSEALLLWTHLHQRKLASQQFCLDAARCFRELGRPEDASRVLGEVMDVFAAGATAEFLDQAGDLAMEISTSAAQDLAEKAYWMASERLRDTISGPAEVKD
ncbi:MAG TPA: PEGA domain-containing protein [Thermoguttaceae bacterium]|nr:PEGA domain-containing protein [Thermoguttaceae bacterium]